MERPTTERVRQVRCPACGRAAPDVSIIATLPVKGEWTAIVKGVDEYGAMRLEGVQSDAHPTRARAELYCENCRHVWTTTKDWTSA